MKSMLTGLSLALVFAATAATAQTSLESVIAKVRSQRLVLPAQTPLVALAPADKEFPRQTYTIQRTFAADGSFTVEWKSSRFQSSQTFRADGTILKSRQVDTVKQISLDIQTDPTRSWVKTVITDKGTVKSDKKTDLKPAIALRDELQLLILQAWAAGIRDGLKFQSLSPDGGMVGDFQILFQPTKDPTKLSDKYTYPEEFKAALPSASYVVADMSLQGVGAFFYPHHFYIVYRPEADGLKFVGYFGEDPKSPLFQYLAAESAKP